MTDVMRDRPILSIIIPVYNTENYLRKCLDSVVSQLSPNLEIILVDDGSSDTSGDICEEYCALNPENIRVIHKKNQGLLLARRTGIQMTTGEYIGHLDSDDYLLPGAVYEILQAISSSSADMILYDFVYGKSKGKDERTIHVIEDPEDFFGDAAQQRMRENYVLGRFLNAMWIKVCKREIVDIDSDYRPYAHVANGEDMLQSMALFDAAGSFAYISKPLVYYRRDNESMSKEYTVKDYYSFRSVYTVQYEYANRWDFSEEQVNTIGVKALDKCMVILGQVRASKDAKEYRKLISVLRSDAFFLRLKAAANTKGVPLYYKFMYLFITHGNMQGICLLNKLLDLKYKRR